MTAVVVLQLVREGVLSLDDPIGRWLPEYPAWRDVTVRSLLTMTSGIPSYDRTMAFLNSFAKWGIEPPAEQGAVGELRRSGTPRCTTGDEGVQDFPIPTTSLPK